MASFADLKRHPLSAEYRDITGPDWFSFCLNFKRVGFLKNRPITLHEGMILDGWQRFMACLETGVEPEFETLALGMDPRAFVEAMNDKRRHETLEEAKARTKARRERVGQAREEGQSLRTIAETEKVSPQTIARDIEKPVVTPVTPEKPAKKVKGKDGKTYSAKKPTPLCPNCQHRKDLGRPMLDKCEACAALSKPTPKVEAAPTPKLCQRCQSLGAEIDGCTACQFIRDNPGKKPPKAKPVPEFYTDDAGTVVPVSLGPIFATVDLYKQFAAQLNACAKTAKLIEESPAKIGKPLDPKKPYQRFFRVFKEARLRMQDLRPALVCPKCGGDTCVNCKEKGYLTNEEREVKP